MTDLLTPEDVAARFGVRIPTVWGWVRDGRIEVIRTPGNRMRFTERAVKAAEDRGLDGDTDTGGDAPPNPPDRN